MDDLFNQEVDHTTLFYILPYYLANTPSFATTPSLPPNSFGENYCAGIIISEDWLWLATCVMCIKYYTIQLFKFVVIYVNMLS